MKVLAGLSLAALAIGGARAARFAAVSDPSITGGTVDVPYTPSPESASYIALGYREAAADLLYVRLLGHFNSEQSTGPGVAGLAEAIASLDPNFHRVYETGANAMTLAKLDQDPSVVLRAIALLETGIRRFPDDWKLPYLAGQMYTQDLRSDDPVKRHEWDDRGALLIESAIRKPGAPTKAATWAAVMRTKLGQHERAVEGLREMLILSNDDESRKRLIAQLAELQKRDANALALEVLEERTTFERSWRIQRRTVPIAMFILVGGRLTPGFEMTDLATGGRDLIVDDVREPLEPLE